MFKTKTAEQLKQEISDSIRRDTKRRIIREIISAGTNGYERDTMVYVPEDLPLIIDLRRFKWSREIEQ